MALGGVAELLQLSKASYHPAQPAERRGGLKQPPAGILDAPHNALSMTVEADLSSQGIQTMICIADLAPMSETQPWQPIRRPSSSCCKVVRGGHRP